MEHKADGVKRFKSFDARVREASRDYYHSRLVVSYAVIDEANKKCGLVELR